MTDQILFIEDDADIQEIVALYLRKSGMFVDVASDASSALRLFQSKSYDLLLTDILLPDLHGTELAQRIRKQSSIPIIFISCKKESQDIVDGLELGADDYITKPFDPNVVVARVRAQLRRFQSGKQEAGNRAKLVWQDQRMRIDPDNYEICVDGQPVTLFAKERQLLLFLANRPNQVFSVEHLYGQIWGWDKVSDVRTVMVHIRTLRKKIEQNPADPRYILTVRGFGYKFVWGHS
ncbi:response regulator transcription factor [Paenibacillus sp. GCM10027628]|uniref:response regulator transcription factor n=1 Tax=Paenibacillus sp. GCM10027628 TaxID=3273413 RepID=UPI00362EF9CD